MARQRRRRVVLQRNVPARVREFGRLPATLRGSKASGIRVILTHQLRRRLHAPEPERGFARPPEAAQEASRRPGGLQLSPGPLELGRRVLVRCGGVSCQAHADWLSAAIEVHRAVSAEAHHHQNGGCHEPRPGACKLPRRQSLQRHSHLDSSRVVQSTVSLTCRRSGHLCTAGADCVSFDSLCMRKGALPNWQPSCLLASCRPLQSEESLTLPGSAMPDLLLTRAIASTGTSGANATARAV